MTQLVEAPETAEPLQHRRSWRSVAEHVAGPGAPALALSYLVHGTGGRDLRPLYVTIALTAVAALVLRTWRQPRTVLLLAAWTIVAAFTISYLHVPAADDRLGHIYRWRASGGYAVAVLQLLAVRAYATDRRRAYAVALVVAGGACLEFAWAFTPWWGGGSPERTMVGTIYWYNQYAAFLSPGAVLGLAVALHNRRPWRFVGWVAFVLGSAGIVYSTSRATMAVTGAACAVVVGFAVVRRTDSVPRLLVRAAGLALAAVALVLAMCQPPLVSSSRSPFAAEQQRTTQNQSIATNGGYRVDFWREAVAVAVHHPVTGAGYGELSRAKTGLVSPALPSSPLAHNGLLQPFADGGLLLGLPVLAGTLLVVLTALRRLRDVWRRRDLVGTAAVTACAALLVHSVVDFDWSYPAVFAVGAVVAGLASARDGGPADA